MLHVISMPNAQLFFLVVVISMYVGIGGTYSLVFDPSKFTSWSDSYIRRMFDVIFVGIGIVAAPARIAKSGMTIFEQLISGKNAKCSQEVLTKGLCQAVLGEFVFFDWESNKCMKTHFSGCSLVSYPDFDLLECQKLCE